jgi:RNA polymerase sigma factor (sigma-70 family)
LAPGSSDHELRALLDEDPERGWRAFVDGYTPTLLALIARDGVADRDDAADVYLRVCERLAEHRCARLKKYDPDRGALAAWLTVFVRNTVVDWVRSRAGRRRLFRSVERLDGVHQRVFELFYWERLRAAEIAETLRVGLADVLDALNRIHEVMSDRHHAQLLAVVTRTSRAASLDSDEVPLRLVPAAGADSVETRLRAREIDQSLTTALASLPREDAAIVRLTFVQGWSRREVQRALHLDGLTSDRIAAILATLRNLLTARHVGPDDAATPGLTFLGEGS